jgi:hypothetical protein
VQSLLQIAYVARESLNKASSRSVVSVTPIYFDIQMKFGDLVVGEFHFFGAFAPVFAP